MRKPKELPEGALERLGMDLKQAKTKSEFQTHFRQLSAPIGPFNYITY
jgi:hypothetical protein